MEMTKEEAIERLKLILETDIMALNGFNTPHEPLKKEIEALKMAIKALEPRKGHWIEHPHEAGPNWEYSSYECSECHIWEDNDSDYCPNCGADMREVVKE